jgi:hypothetical protein
MATKDEGDQEEGTDSGSRASTRKAAASAPPAISTATHAPTNTSLDGADPNAADHVPQIAGQEVQFAADAKDVDTFRNPVVLSGPPYPDPNDPGQQLVRVNKDVIEEFHHTGEARTSRRMVMAAGTLTTRRLAEEAGVKDYKEYQP